MTSSLLLCDLAARDLVATNTSIFRTGSSSTAKRIGKEATPLNPTAHRELNRTEPNNPQARYIELTHTHTTYSRRSTTTNNNRVCFSSWLFCYYNKTDYSSSSSSEDESRIACIRQTEKERKKPVSSPRDISLVVFIFSGLSILPSTFFPPLSEKFGIKKKITWISL